MESIPAAMEFMPVETGSYQHNPARHNRISNLNSELISLAALGNHLISVSCHPYPKLLTTVRDIEKSTVVHKIIFLHQMISRRKISHFLFV
jgi:hypothetical protein